jgi:hypothetical protein
MIRRENMTCERAIIILNELWAKYYMDGENACDEKLVAIWMGINALKETQKIADSTRKKHAL